MVTLESFLNFHVFLCNKVDSDEAENIVSCHGMINKINLRAMFLPAVVLEVPLTKVALNLPFKVVCSSICATL